MSSVLSQSLAAQLAGLDQFQRGNVGPFSPAMAFAGFVFKRAGASVPDYLDGAKVVLDTRRLDEAPMLAAAGCGMAAGLWRPALPDEAAWLKALQRLQRRELFPVDRSSFAYRPLEVVGIALGLSSCKHHDDQQVEWLKGALGELSKLSGGSFWESTLYQFAGDILGLQNKVNAPRQWAGLLSRELALARWIGSVSGSFVSFADQNFAPLDEALLLTSLESGCEVHDLAEAAVLSFSLRQAIQARLRSAIADTWLLSKSAQDAASLVGSICRRFPLFAKKLQKRHGKRSGIGIQDEYDVQDLMHALLQLHFDDVRPEETTPSHGGSSARMDFLLMPEEVVVEAKMTRKNLGQRDLTSQLAEDKERYKSHPHCRTLICFVYDPDGYCDKPNALEKDLSETTERMRVIVIVAPKGL
jgi:hypothetical protein